MGQARKTEEDYSVGEILACKVTPDELRSVGQCITIRNFLQNERPAMWAETTLDDMLELSDAIRRFAHNRWRFMSGDATDEELLLKHAAFTMLVPGGKAARAREAVDRLFQTGLPWLTSYTDKDVATMAEIIRPYVRFYKTKARNLARLWEKFPDIEAELIKFDAATCRDFLVETVSGFGLKAASHFMRNVGLSSFENALAIVDVHIRHFLFTVAYDAPYVVVEREFVHLAEKLNVNVHLLDACVWCAYSKNWKPDNADFDNFGVE